MNIEYSPIGTIRSPFAQPTDMPIQPTGAIGVQGTIDVLDEFRAGLKDLASWSERPRRLLASDPALPLPPEQRF